MTIDLNAIISFLTSGDVQQKLFWVKVTFLAVGGIFLAAIIYLILTTNYLRWLFVQDFWEFFTFRPFGAKRITKIWRKIVRRLDTGLEQEYRSAVVEADDMFDASLNRMGYRGQNLEERLDKLTFATLPNIKDVYEAHKIRNSIVRDPDYRLTLEEAKRTLDIFEKAFNALQILT